MAGYYSQSYAAISGKNRQFDAAKIFANDILSQDKRFIRAKAQADALRHQGAVFDTVYDFGFGLGFFFLAANACCKQGFDIDPQTEPFARHLSIDVRAPWDVSPGTVDCLLTSHSTEHIEIEALDYHVSSFFAMLRVGGLLAVEVPHAALSWIDKKGAHRPHTLFFSAEGLERLFVRHGFSPVKRSFASAGPMAPRAAHPIYDPPDGDAFFSSQNASALFMIFAK